MRFGVVVFPGSNCDDDCYYVVRDVVGEEVYPLRYRFWPSIRVIAGVSAVESTFRVAQLSSVFLPFPKVEQGGST